MTYFNSNNRKIKRKSFIGSATGLDNVRSAGHRRAGKHFNVTRKHFLGLLKNALLCVKQHFLFNNSELKIWQRIFTNWSRDIFFSPAPVSLKQLIQQQQQQQQQQQHDIKGRLLCQLICAEIAAHNREAKLKTSNKLELLWITLL